MAIEARHRDKTAYGVVTDEEEKDTK